MTSDLLLDITEGVALVTFNRPHALNALNQASMLAFESSIQQITQDESIRVVVIRGADEKAFCSGGDLQELRHKPTASDAQAMIDLMGDCLMQLERLPVPVIAAVNGYALGGGSEIALACDMRIVDENVKMGFVQINMALTPGWGAGQRLLRLVGYAKAMELLLSAEHLTADKLSALHLVNRVVGVGQAPQHTLEFARQIAKRPPNVVKSMKQLLQNGLNMPYEAAQTAERQLFPALWEDEAHLQAVEDFFKKQEVKKEK
jgi:enoyl-CoA hydratase